MQQFFYKIKIAVTDLLLFTLTPDLGIMLKSKKHLSVTDLLLFTLTPDLGIMLKSKKHLSTRIHHKGMPESEDRNTRTLTLSGRVCE